MLEMGFARNRAVRALHFSGNDTLEVAIAWLDEHATYADVDDPLLLPKVRLRAQQRPLPCPQLTPTHVTRRPRS